MNTFLQNIIRFSGLPLIIIFSGSFIWLFWPVLTDLVRDWGHDPNNSHGFLIPIITGYFLWRKRQYILSAELNPSNKGLFIIFMGLLVYLLGYLGAAHTTIRVSMFIFIAGSVIYLYGFSMMRAIMFPYLYALFMIPVPYYLYETVAFPLRLFVTSVAVKFISLIGIPVIREGNIIMLENITLQVVDACSGIRSLTSLLALTVAYAYISQNTLRRRVVLVLSAIPIAVISNILRVVITGILSRYLGARAAYGFFHEFAGLGVFLISLFIVIGVGTLLAKGDRGHKEKER